MGETFRPVREALGAFGIGIAEMTVTGLLGRVAADLQTSPAAVGTAISLYALGVVAGVPLITIAGARVPRHRLLPATLLLFIAGNTAALAAPNLALFCLARFVAGLPHGAYLALAAATAASLVPRERRGRATALVGIGQTIASIVGVPSAIFLGQALSWRAALALAVLVFVAAFAAVLTFVPRDTGGTVLPVAALRSPGLWAGFAVAASAFAGLYCVLSFIAPITTDVAGLPADATPVVLMLYGAGMTAGAIAGGRAADWDVARAVPIGGVAACAVLAGFAAMMDAS
ncbi:MFS transporter [Catenuloplanes indicus]|uniref:MFS family arabinose efflux permease n=1 Tax=Catenuloplanes indicus TaxID=137267 RepID=A0AAE3W8H8_9ACTN|nr:MFS transporter [Catenuloplanes indicus]MDQ0371411.1 putative MFS family arabinose efflux permease [Catenuloplanes indicus]